MNFVDYIFEFCDNYKKTAVIIYNEEFTYDELFYYVDKTVMRLKNEGVKKGDKLLLSSDNSLFFIYSYFAIMKIGCTCIPINPNNSIDDIHYILQTCNIDVVLCQNKYVKKFNDINRPLKIYTERELESNNKEYKKYKRLITPSEIVDKEDLALILFTSGSTGKSKGVMLTHYNLVYNTNSIIEYLKLTSDDRIEVVLPFYYCYGASLLHTHFRVGGSVVLNNRFMFPLTVLEDINKYKCTGFAGVPSNFQILLRKTNMKDYEFPTLRYITQAGGKLPNVFIEELCETLPSTKVFIMYGQTEATARLSYLPPEYIKTKAGSIGKGIPGTKLMVINSNGQEIKPGQVGEVVAVGGNVMKGYFNDKEETSKVLKNGYLYTGDLATIDEDGFIYIVSREKQIIKSGGNRISPKEIEDIIVQIPEVVEAAVIGVEDEILGEAPKVYVVLNSKNIDEKYVMDYCKKSLPSYKVPKYIEFLDSLPKNSSGKIMFKELKR